MRNVKLKCLDKNKMSVSIDENNIMHKRNVCNIIGKKLNLKLMYLKENERNS